MDLGKINEFLENNQRKRLRNKVSKAGIPELSLTIDQLDEKKKVQFYLMIPTSRSSDVLLEVSPYSRKIILKSLKEKYVISMIEKADSDDSVDILGEVPKNRQKRIIKNLPKQKKEAIEPLIRYEEDSAGGLMQSELIAVKSGLKASEAINIVKRKIKNIDGFNYIYVIDSKQKLKGVVTLQNLISVSNKRKIYQIMNRDIIKLRPNVDKEKVAEIFKKEDLLALPVVDTKGKLLGRVTVDDVLDVMEEEATEDMFKIAGIHPDESIFDPLKKSIKRRLPWLILNLGTAFLAALVVSLFTDTLQSMVILAAFMPIIAGVGGNSGTQTLTLIVRGFALNRLEIENYKKIILKEVSVGLINGLSLGIIMGLIALIWQQNIFLSIVIFSAMAISLTLAGFIATSVPFVLKSLKIDPAVASSVFITASIDIVGFFAFLGIATLLLHTLA